MHSKERNKGGTLGESLWGCHVHLHLEVERKDEQS